MDAIANKGCLHIKIQKGDEKINVLNMHLQAGAGINIRMKQLEEINNFMEKLEIPEEEGIILGGDFNLRLNCIQGDLALAELYTG